MEDLSNGLKNGGNISCEGCGRVLIIHIIGWANGAETNRNNWDDCCRETYDKLINRKE